MDGERKEWGWPEYPLMLHSMLLAGRERVSLVVTVSEVSHTCIQLPRI